MDKKIFNPTNGYIFNYTIQTDGIGCSLLFKNESLKDKRFKITDAIEQTVQSYINSFETNKINLIYPIYDQ